MNKGNVNQADSILNIFHEQSDCIKPFKILLLEMHHSVCRTHYTVILYDKFRISHTELTFQKEKLLCKIKNVF